jgi:hypothetical protein
MGRIVISKDGGSIHIGGRKRPSKKFGIALDDKKYGLNLSQWPTTPASTFYGTLPAVQDLLNDILGNDTHGDCTIVDRFKRQGLRQAVGGRPVFHPTFAQVLMPVYSRCGGYVDGEPSTDNGCDETVVLGDEQVVGNICDDSGTVNKTTAYMTIDPSNTALVRACATMFPGLSICAELCSDWIANATNGSTWDVPQGGYIAIPTDGHCFTLLDQTDRGFPITTWARRIFLTANGLAECASEANGGSLFVIVDDEILNTASNVAPDGLDWATVIADFNALPSVMVPPGP